MMSYRMDLLSALGIIAIGQAIFLSVYHSTARKKHLSSSLLGVLFMRPPERWPRPQISRRDVQLGVLNEDLHDAASIDSHGLRQRPDFVRKSDLRRVE